MRFLKFLLFACCIVGAACSLASFTTRLAVKSLFEQLGLSQEEANEDIRTSLISGYVFVRNASILKPLSQASRAQLVREVTAYAKTYVTSPEFTEAYQAEREAYRPLKENYVPENISFYSKEEQNQMQQDFTMALREWEQFYPEDARFFIKRRLQEFLSLTADVDFDATLKDHPSDKKKIFANPDYEAKSEEWKRVYRAGKEPTQAAQQFARQWLKELP